MLVTEQQECRWQQECRCNSHGAAWSAYAAPCLRYVRHPTSFRAARRDRIAFVTGEFCVNPMHRTLTLFVVKMNYPLKLVVKLLRRLRYVPAGLRACRFIVLDR